MQRSGTWTMHGPNSTRMGCRGAGFGFYDLKTVFFSSRKSIAIHKVVTPWVVTNFCVSNCVSVLCLISVNSARPASSRKTFTWPCRDKARASWKPRPMQGRGLGLQDFEILVIQTFRYWKNPLTALHTTSIKITKSIPTEKKRKTWYRNYHCAVLC